MQILVFVRKLTDKLKMQELREGLNIRYIPFDSNCLDDLLNVARFRVINFPTSLIIDNRGNVLLKMRGAVPTSYIDNLCKMKLGEANE